MSCFKTIESMGKLQKDTKVEEYGFLDGSKKDQCFQGKYYFDVQGQK
jgi:hypothetical protein